MSLEPWVIRMLVEIVLVAILGTWIGRRHGREIRELREKRYNSAEELAVTLRRLHALQSGMAALLGMPEPYLHDPGGNGDLLAVLRERLRRTT